MMGYRTLLPMNPDPRFRKRRCSNVRVLLISERGEFLLRRQVEVETHAEPPLPNRESLGQSMSRIEKRIRRDVTIPVIKRMRNY